MRSMGDGALKQWARPRVGCASGVSKKYAERVPRDNKGLQRFGALRLPLTRGFTRFRWLTSYAGTLL
jgi:hypothetical protein